MPSEFDYVGKPVEDWTEAELRHAQNHPEVINKNLTVVIEARLSAIESNQRLIRERSRSQREKRLLPSFVDKSSKPAKSVDYVSVKQSAQDATTKKGGGPAITVGTLIYAYDWISSHPELVKLLPKDPVVIWAGILFGFGWWVILFVVRLNQKWNEEH